MDRWCSWGVQVQKNDGTQIDAADTNIYFVVSGLCHLSAVEKQVVGDTAREDAESSAEAAAPWAQRLGQSGPLAKVRSGWLDDLARESWVCWLAAVWA